jgi:hypothetical protein
VFGSCASSRGSPTEISRRDAKPPAGSEIVWVPHGHGRTECSVDRPMKAWTGGGRCARPPASLCHPAGVGCGVGGGARLAAQGASRSPSPAHRAGKDRPRQVRAQRANRSSRCPRGSWNGWPVGPDGVGVAATRACDPGWENGWPFGPNDGPFGRQMWDVNGDRYISPPPGGDSRC